jgi:hypothetical protein
MDEMRALADEQRKAGLLLDDGAPVRLAISAVERKEKEEEEEKKIVVAKPVFGQEEEEETAGRRRRGNLVKLDFEAAERERLVERLHRARDSVPKSQDALWRSKVKWDALGEVGFIYGSSVKVLTWAFLVYYSKENYTPRTQETRRVPRRTGRRRYGCVYR